MTYGRACSRSAEPKQACLFSCLIATFGSTLGYRIATEGISQIEFWEQVAIDGQGDVAPASGESKGIAIVGITVGFREPLSVMLLGHRDVSFTASHELNLFELLAANNHRIIALPRFLAAFLHRKHRQ